jgi:hypothetical protein
MNLRQRLKDDLLALRASRVVDLRAFKIAYILYKSCEYALADYRQNHKWQDVA